MIVIHQHAVQRVSAMKKQTTTSSCAQPKADQDGARKQSSCCRTTWSGIQLYNLFLNFLLKGYNVPLRGLMQQLRGMNTHQNYTPSLRPRTALDG
jgi:hypothetical protein